MYWLFLELYKCNFKKFMDDNCKPWISTFSYLRKSKLSRIPAGCRDKMTRELQRQNFTVIFSHLSGSFRLFSPKFGRWQGPTNSFFLLEMNATWWVVTIWGGGNTQILPTIKCCLKNWPRYVWASLALFHLNVSSVNVFSEHIQWITSPPMSHLVKVSLPNILNRYISTLIRRTVRIRSVK